MKRIPKKKMLEINKRIKQAIKREEYEYDRYVEPYYCGQDV